MDSPLRDVVRGSAEFYGDALPSLTRAMAGRQHQQECPREHGWERRGRSPRLLERTVVLSREDCIPLMSSYSTPEMAANIVGTRRGANRCMPMQHTSSRVRIVRIAGLLVATTIALGSTTACGRMAPEAPRVVSACPPSMAHVGTSCVDKYEASLVEIHDDGSEAPFSPYAAPNGHDVRAVSSRGVVPQAHISMIEAKRACEASQQAPLPAQEWKAACKGPASTRYPYGNTRVAGACVDTNRTSPMNVLHQRRAHGAHDERSAREPADEHASSRRARRESCTNGYGVHDMVGNVHEWTDDGSFRGGYYLDTKLNGEGCDYRTTAHAPRLLRLLDRASAAARTRRPQHRRSSPRSDGANLGLRAPRPRPRPRPRPGRHGPSLLREACVVSPAALLACPRERLTRLPVATIPSTPAPAFPGEPERIRVADGHPRPALGGSSARDTVVTRTRARFTSTKTRRRARELHRRCRRQRHPRRLLANRRDPDRLQPPGASRRVEERSLRLGRWVPAFARDRAFGRMGRHRRADADADRAEGPHARRDADHGRGGGRERDQGRVHPAREAAPQRSRAHGCRARVMHAERPGDGERVQGALVRGRVSRSLARGALAHAQQGHPQARLPLVPVADGAISVESLPARRQQGPQRRGRGAIRSSASRRSSALIRTRSQRSSSSQSRARAATTTPAPTSSASSGS